MTSKLKCPVCPFCAGKLYCSDNCYSCLNDKCLFGDFYFVAKRWNAIIELKQDLIQAKQDLEIARQALDWVGNNRLAENPVRIEQLRRHARNALEQIEHKE